MEKWRRLTYADRIYLEDLLHETADVNILAKKLGVHYSTVYRELHRGGVPYSAETAQKK